MWQNWVAFIFGLWLIVAPWVLGFSDSKAGTWDSVVFGVLIAGLTLWSQLQSGQTSRRAGA